MDVPAILRAAGVELEQNQIRGFDDRNAFDQEIEISRGPRNAMHSHRAGADHREQHVLIADRGRDGIKGQYPSTLA